MLVLRIFVVATWLAIAWLTVAAVNAAGAAAGGDYFFAQYANPWGAQLMTDTGIHLALLALWIFWREENKLVGPVCALASLFAGALFSMPYLFLATLRARGDIVRLLVGNRSPIP